MEMFFNFKKQSLGLQILYVALLLILFNRNTILAYKKQNTLYLILILLQFFGKQEVFN